jgi:glycosyltransferase involved in cell wall biosynthesis
MQITVVIPTCNRKDRLLLLLGYLNQTSSPIEEVIIVDAGENKLVPSEYMDFARLKILYLESEKSVFIQIYKCIRKAQTDFIFLCDDYLEFPSNYLEKLMRHA